MAAQVVRQEHKFDPSITEASTLDVAVSMDVLWHKQGHQSNIVIVCAIDILINIYIDYHVMSKVCQKCATTGKKKAEEGNIQYQLWKVDHQEECCQNFNPAANSGSIEETV